MKKGHEQHFQCDLRVVKEKTDLSCSPLFLAVSGSLRTATDKNWGAGVPVRAWGLFALLVLPERNPIHVPQDCGSVGADVWEQDVCFKNKHLVWARVMLVTGLPCNAKGDPVLWF